MCTCMSVYLSCEVKGRGLGNCTVHLPEHLTELRHHRSKVVQQSLHRLLKDSADRLRNNMKSVSLKCHIWLKWTNFWQKQRSDSMQLHMLTTYLYNLRIVEPLAEYCLYESKHLLQNHDNLKHTNKLHENIEWRESKVTNKQQHYMLAFTHGCMPISSITMVEWQGKFFSCWPPSPLNPAIADEFSGGCSGAHIAASTMCPLFLLQLLNYNVLD